MDEDLSLVTDMQTREALDLLRSAVVFEKEETTNAPFEAQRLAEERIERAHRRTIKMIRLARDCGATKTMIANQFGVQSLYKVTKLIKEADEL